LVGQRLEEEWEDILNFLKAKLDQFRSILVEEGIDPPEILQECERTIEQVLFSSIVVLVPIIGDVRKQDVGDRATKNARIPDLEIALVRLLQTFFVDVVSTATELKERSLGLDHLGKDILVAEIAQQVRVA
jgi:hypothetical protein